MGEYQRVYRGYEISKTYHQSLKRPAFQVWKGDSLVATVFTWDEVEAAVARYVAAVSVPSLDGVPLEPRKAPKRFKGVSID